MRFFPLFAVLLFVSLLSACGSEEEIIPPTYSDIRVNTELATAERLLIPYTESEVTISGMIDDLSAKIVATTAAGDVDVPVVPIDNSKGSWTFLFPLLEESANSVTFAATDQRGNVNRLYLTVLRDTTPSIE